jgi:Uma2 family endonuclease
MGARDLHQPAVALDLGESGVKTVGAVEMGRWSREQYEKMIETGIFSPDTRAELINGEILNMTPQKRRHAAAIRAAEEALRTAFGIGYDVQVQLPLALDVSSEPEPDLSVVRGSWRDYRDAHPSSAVLVVEVADTSLEYDRDRKGSLYARAGIADYWVVNLPAGRIEVYRDPGQSDEALYGWSYRSIQFVGPGQHLAPLAAPESPIAVDDLLP